MRIQTNDKNVIPKMPFREGSDTRGHFLSSGENRGEDFCIPAREGREETASPLSHQPKRHPSALHGKKMELLEMTAFFFLHSLIFWGIFVAALQLGSEFTQVKILMYVSGFSGTFTSLMFLICWVRYNNVPRWYRILAVPEMSRDEIKTLYCVQRRGNLFWRNVQFAGVSKGFHTRGEADDHLNMATAGCEVREQAPGSQLTLRLVSVR